MINLEHNHIAEALLLRWRSRLEKHPITDHPVVTEDDLQRLIKELLDTIESFSSEPT